MKLFKGLLREKLVERKRNGKVPSQHLCNDLVGGVRRGHCDQITCKVQMAAPVARDCLTNRYLEQAWRLERVSTVAHDMNVVLDATKGMRECGLVADGVQPIIVLLSTTNFLRCVQFSAEHWPNDGVESRWNAFEWFRGKTRRATLR